MSVVISYIDDAILRGYGFQVYHMQASITSGASVDFLFSGAKEMRIHEIYVETDKAPFGVLIYENPIKSVAGTPLPIYNRNRESLVLPQIAVEVGATFSDLGTQIDQDEYTAGGGGTKSQTVSANGLLAVWGNGKSHLYRLTNNSGQTAKLNLRLFWTEQP